MAIKNKVVRWYLTKELRKYMELLKGKKTYIVALAFAGLAFAEHMNWITKDISFEIMTFLNGAGFAALKASKK